MRPKSSTAKRLLSLITAISVMTMCAASTVFAAPPNTTFLPDFSKELLTPTSQAATAWTNTIPNALADYYTFIPYSNADALAMGIRAGAAPGSSNCGVSADCYTISARKFGQPTSLEYLKNPAILNANLFPGTGLLQAGGVTPFYNHNTLTGTLTTAWGYGSGGAGWMPNYPAGPTLVKGNAPTAFQNVPFNATFGPGQNGDPAAKGIWHFPAPTIKGTKNRPVYVQWLNDLPNEKPAGFDPSIDCGLNAPYGFPYNRLVTHVHGAHVGPESDGLTTAWYTPNFALQGEGAFPSSAYTTFGPPGTYKYPMDQEASTIWYHDHAMGTTHLNTNMGMAGFFPITDMNEQSLLTPLAGPARALPNTLYDYGFALQDRNYDTTAQMVMPDYGIYNRADPACTLTVDGLPDPTTCPRLQWMKEVDGHLVPYVAGSPLLLNANNIGFANLTGPYELPGQGAPFPAASATLEYFGNMPVVNGVTYGKIDMEARINRMRFIGGTDSRAWIMQLVRQDTMAVVPFYQIGSEQGLLNKPVLRNVIDLMPGERIDVLVDFNGIPAATKVKMMNLGGDTPYSGYQDYLAGAITPSADIPQIMEFNVIAKGGNSNSTPIATLLAAATPLRPQTVALADGSGLPIVLKGAPVVTRNVSLIEITDQYGRTMPTIDGRGFLPPGVPVTEIILPGQVEQWDIINTTVDAHPMHIHQVAFQTLNRQAIDLFIAPGVDIANQNFTAPTYTPAGAVLPADIWDAGEKDTVQCPPGYVTRVKMVFDVLGDYVWHCHILSHEEHDMMRPFKVTNQAVAPTFVNVPAINTEGRYTVAWGGTAIPGAQFVLQEKVGAGAFATIYTGASTKVDLFRPVAGTYSYQVGVAATAFGAGTFTASPFTAVSNGDVAFSPTATVLVAFTSTMLTPANTAILAGASQVFTWANTNAAAYQLWIGTTVGALNLGKFPAIGTTATTATVTGLPTNGSTVNVRLWSLIGTTWSFNDYTYTSGSVAGVANMVTPANATTLTGASQAFTWTNAGATLYQAWVGTTLGSNNLGMFPSPASAATTTTVTGLPINGSPVFVRLWSKNGVTWSSNDYTYTAASPAVMISPISPSTLAGASRVFTWSNTGATAYQLWVGATAGSLSIGKFPNVGSAATTATVTGLPANGGAINVRLWSQLADGTWIFNDYPYISGP